MRVRLTDAEARARAARVDDLLGHIEALDERARDLVADTLSAVMELYGEALARLVERVPGDGLAGDDVIAHVLLLHGLHPDDVSVRIARAVEEARGALRAQHADVELVDVTDGVARLRVRRKAGGCSSSSASLERTIEDAVQRAAPDLDRVVIETVVEEPPAVFIPVDTIRLKKALA